MGGQFDKRFEENESDIPECGRGTADWERIEEAKTFIFEVVVTSVNCQ